MFPDCIFGPLPPASGSISIGEYLQSTDGILKNLTHVFAMRGQNSISRNTRAVYG